MKEYLNVCNSILKKKEKKSIIDLTNMDTPCGYNKAKNKNNRQNKRV